MKKIFIYLISISTVLSFSSCMVSRTDSNRIAMEKNKEKLSKDERCDASFAVMAANGEMFIDKASSLAETKSSSPDVKALAAQLKESHSSSYKKLETLASSKKISLPEKLSDKSQKALDRLSSKTGKDFDKAYLKCMKHEHKGGIAFVKREAKKGKDADIKAWAAEKEPKLQKLYESIKETCAKVK